ncbi:MULTISPECIES: YjjG family noncanonical pyrimidine nucleotidase [unclassified Polaribacter]|uniref:YjjG family noncanonical pyrimidine nucleotidase n=1 Tax=unclassified Polaribacter TaxID=196858 RepID=UPI0011BE20E9|nr:MULTISPECIES: YjjG family noncanonical pyrimidine nucleotidase [unclassified Polaribacter]TXD54289.1 noncanonical pyrimidine nucleotidase, YjjG family [Polaribacter sp. IC063]TXD62880.1 noncanonical pyrimidine nucleotidase, YjjG family [Polaribacter sp. IC066]
MAMKIKHVFFDLDHTLWDFEKNSDLTFEKIFLKHNVKIDLVGFLKIYKPLNIEYWKLYREEKITKEELRYQRLKTAFDSANYEIEDNLIDLLAIDYIACLPDFNHLHEGAIEILEYLKDKYQLHIITNGFEEIQTKKMESSKILHYFSVIVTSESVGVKKPNPKVFNFALEKANAQSDNSIMIGDSIEADIEGALSVGMNAIHVNFEKEKVNNVYFKSITSLLDIKQHL